MNNKIKILLVLSLCVNVLLGGIFIGMEGRKYARHNDDNKHFNVEMKKFRATQKNEKRELFNERKVAIDMIVSDNYNKGDYLAQIEKINTLQGEMYKDMSLKMAELLQGMNSEERKSMVRILEKRLSPPKKQ